MGWVSKREDELDRQMDGAENIVQVGRQALTLRELPDGHGARAPRLRADFVRKWKEFETSVRELESFLSLPLPPASGSKRRSALIDRAIGSSHRHQAMVEKMEALVSALPPSSVRATLESGLAEIRRVDLA